ncbi:glutathione S-transferase-like protein [Russula dissimulans]|nr:glutathione S-transferase-like protein [Russula dissimulans]
MAFKLYGNPRTPSTRRVALIAKERNIPYESVLVDFATYEHKQPSHLAHQPFGQVPYITQEDGFELFESRAIGRYLATLGSGPELIPTDPKARARFEQAASIEYAQISPILRDLVVEKIIKQLRGQTTDEERVKESISQLEAKLDVFDTILSKQKYLAGDEITLADLFIIPTGALVFDRLELGNLEKRTHVQRWWREISSRPSWKAVENGV